MAEQQKTTYENLKRQKKGIYYNNSTSSIEINDIEDQNPIVHFNAIQERLYGKHPTKAELIRDTKFGKPNLNQSFNTDVDLWNVLLPVAKSGFLEQQSIDAISEAQPVMGHLFKTMERVAEIDFTPLRNIDEKYDEYTEIPDSYLQQYTACAIYYDFHMGSVMRYMGNNYINAHIDVEEVEKRCRGIVPDKVLDDLIRLFTFGSPAYINGESTRKNFYDYWKYGNHSTVEKDMKKMIKTLLKEFKNQWMIPLPCWVARFVPHGHITPEGLVQKPHKKDRPVFDASALLFWYSICINMLTHTDNEPDIHYGETLINILIRIWNLRITYPLEDILLMCDDIAGAFRIGKYNPEIISAFMYRIHKYYKYATCPSGAR